MSTLGLYFHIIERKYSYQEFTLNSKIKLLHGRPYLAAFKIQYWKMSVFQSKQKLIFFLSSWDSIFLKMSNNKTKEKSSFVAFIRGIFCAPVRIEQKSIHKSKEAEAAEALIKRSQVQRRQRCVSEAVTVVRRGKECF